MAEAGSTDLEMLDQALIQLRRFLQAPRTVPDGDRPIELSTLLVLEVLDRHSPATIAEIAQRLDVAHSTASRLVQRAVDTGMVGRRPTKGKRRAAIAPTADGSALTRRAQAFRRHQLRQRLQGWTSDEVHQFSQALHRFAAAGNHRIPEVRTAGWGRSGRPE